MGTVPLTFGDHEPGSAMPVEVANRTRRENLPTKALADSLLALVERLEGESKERIIQLHRRGVRLQKLYEGDHGDFHPSGSWMSRPSWGLGSTKDKRTGKRSAFYPHNKTRRYIDAAVAQRFQSRIDLRAVSTSQDDRSELAASMARPIVDYHEQQLFTESFITDEEKQKRFFGQVFYFKWWDHNSGPLIDDLGVDFEDYTPNGSIYTCLRCAQSGDEQDFALMNGACPQCGSTAVAEEQPETIQMPKIISKGKKRAGDCMVTIVPSLQMNYDRACSPFGFSRQALWYDWTRRFRIEEIQKTFPDYKVPEQRDTAGSYERSGLDLLEDSTGNTGGGIRFRKTQVRRSTVKAIWLRPAMLEEIILNQPVPLAGGDAIPANVKLSEIYSNALYVLVSGRDVLDLWDDSLIDYRWSQLKHNHVPNRTDGDGNEDVIRPAQEYNAMRSMTVASVIFNSARPQWVLPPLAARDFTGQPGYIGEPKGVPPGTDLAKYHHVADPNPLDQAVVLMQQGADSEMRDTLAAYGPVTGDPTQQEGQGTKTLGGMEMLNSNGNAQQLPAYALIAAAYREIHLDLLAIFRECATEERFVPFYGKAGELAGQYFKGADLEGDIDLVYSKGSYVPKDEARKRANLMWALNVGQGIILNPQCPPTLKQYILETAGCTDLELDSFEADVKEARRRVEEMKRLALQAEQMGAMITRMAQQVAPDLMGGGQDDSQADLSGNTQFGGGSPSGEPVAQSQGGAVQTTGMAGAENAGVGMGSGSNAGGPSPGMVMPPSAAEILCQMVPIDPKVDEHPIHFAFIKNLLKSDEARKMNPVVNEALHMRLDEHEQAGAMLAAQQQQLGMIAAGPQLALADSQKQDDNRRAETQTADDRSHKMEMQDRKLASDREVAKTKADQTRASKR